MKVLVTGADGFLGWHLRVRMRARTTHQVVSATRATWSELDSLVRGADAIVHVAGVNRGSGTEVHDGNVRLADDVARAVRTSGERPAIIFANSTQAGTDSPYGVGKAEASALLAQLAADLGTKYLNLRLPNLFGEHGRPRYNSFVSTFIEAVINETPPPIVDRPIELLHAQQAAQLIIDALDTTRSGVLTPSGAATTVQHVFDTLKRFHYLYGAGDIPALGDDLDLDLFNAFRAALFPSRSPLLLVPRSDHRGSLVEVVRSHGGTGQTFVSTTRPGITRGEHFHIRKVERFVVLGGRAHIALRRIFSDEVVTFEVDERTPAAIDMPTMWAHRITNTGDQDLTTLFWTNDLFNAESPDTYPELVDVPAMAA